MIDPIVVEVVAGVEDVELRTGVGRAVAGTFVVAELAGKSGSLPLSRRTLRSGEELAMVEVEFGAVGPWLDAS